MILLFLLTLFTLLHVASIINFTIHIIAYKHIISHIANVTLYNYACQICSIIIVNITDILL